MALVTSIQSGSWSDPDTWDSASVPDLAYDDVVVAEGHEVYIDGYDYLTLGYYRFITVENGGWLSISGSLDVDYGGALDVYGDLSVEGGGSLHVMGYLSVGAWAYLDVWGYFSADGGWVDIYGQVYVAPYYSFDVVYGASMYVYGSFYQDWSAYSTFYQGAHVEVAVGGSAYFDGYLYVEDYSDLYVYGGAEFSYSGNVEVRYYGNLYVQPGGSLMVRNYLNVADSGNLYVYGDMTLDGYLYVYGWSGVYVEYGGMLTINGGASVEYYSTLSIYYDGRLTVGVWGYLEAYYYASIYFDYLSRSDLFGYFRLYYDAYLYLGGEAIVRVYREMSISGQMNSDGGRIVMMRREGRITDTDGDTLFVFDQAYGFAPRLIA